MLIDFKVSYHYIDEIIGLKMKLKSFIYTLC